MTTPELYDVRSDDPNRKAKVQEPLKQFWDRILAVFSKDEGVRVFATLGEPEGQDAPLEKYRDISAVPMEKRRAAFSNLPPKDKSDLVRTHLALYLARHSELNDAQKMTILEGISLTTPELYDVRSDYPDWKAKVQEPLKQFWDRILTVFSRDEGVRVFATLGEPEPPLEGVFQE